MLKSARSVLGIARIDGNGRFITVNVAYAALVGYKPPELIGMPWQCAVHPDERSRAEATYQEMLEKGKAEVEMQGLRKDGTLFWMRVLMVKNCSEGHYCFSKDITRDMAERKRVEAALSESEDRHRAIAEAASDVIVTIDEQSTILFINRAVERIFGYKCEEMLGQKLTMLMPESLRPPHVAALRRYVETRERHIAWAGVELKGLHKDGKIIPLEVSFGESKRNGALLFTGIIRNITERKRAEESLREEEERFRLLVEGVKDYAIIMLDPAGRVISWNAGAQRTIGYEAGEILGKHFSCFLPAEDVERGEHRRVLTVAVEEGRCLIEEGWRVRRDGSRFWAEVATTALKSPEGNLRGFSKIMRDITEHKRAEERMSAQVQEVERSNEELQQFAFCASHDLQEPLRKVQAFGDRLKAKCWAALTDEGRDYLERMQTAAKRMQTLIDNLLTYSRVTTRGQSFARVDLGAVAREVLSDLEVMVEQTRARVELGELPSIEADPMQMRQLLQNLIGNALKFHKPGQPPIVKVHADLNGGPCKITVEDDGIGFEQKYAERIFTIFQRLHGHDKYHGTGIGLATCRKIAERHGGTITASSAPDQGAKFFISLPVKQSRRGCEK